MHSRRKNNDSDSRDPPPRLEPATDVARPRPRPRSWFRTCRARTTMSTGVLSATAVRKHRRYSRRREMNRSSLPPPRPTDEAKILINDDDAMTSRSLSRRVLIPTQVTYRPNSVKIKSRYFAGFCGLKHVPCMSNLLGVFVLGHYGAL